jgi:hypothetical protein
MQQSLDLFKLSTPSLVGFDKLDKSRLFVYHDNQLLAFHELLGCGQLEPTFLPAAIGSVTKLNFNLPRRKTVRFSFQEFQQSVLAITLDLKWSQLSGLN